jgi:hypothetical protein
MPQRGMWSIKRFCYATIYALILIVVVGVSGIEAQVRTLPSQAQLRIAPERYWSERKLR